VIAQLDQKELLMMLSARAYQEEAQPYDKLLTNIATQQPDIYKAAYQQWRDSDRYAKAESMIYLAKQLPLDFDADFVMELLTNNVKHVRELAFDRVKARPELRDKVLALAQSKKKAEREVAEKLLMI
jgi:hypothetical protein